MTRNIPLSKAQDDLASLLDEIDCGGLKVVIEREGKPAAALVPIADLRRLEALREDFFERLERMAAYAATQASQEEIEAAIAEAVEEVEQEARARATKAS